MKCFFAPAVEAAGSVLSGDDSTYPIYLHKFCQRQNYNRSTGEWPIFAEIPQLMLPNSMPDGSGDAAAGVWAAMA